jgi:hypothetical protein
MQSKNANDSPTSLRGKILTAVTIMEYEPCDQLASYLVIKLSEETPVATFIVKAAMLVATSGTTVYCRSTEGCVMDSKTVKLFVWRIIASH